VGVVSVPDSWELVIAGVLAALSIRLDESVSLDLVLELEYPQSDSLPRLLRGELDFS